MQFAETVRNGLVNRGVAVDRVYTTDAGENPLKLNDGTPLPGGAAAPDLGWNGSGADVASDWNAGRFLIIHRDHGYAEGWGSPGFSSTDVNALTNTNAQLPVVMSINCASGDFDQVNDSFAQTALVKPVGGAVAVFGDTRNSPSWESTQLGFGLVDGLLPSVLPSEGPATAQRLGSALITASCGWPGWRRRRPMPPPRRAVSVAPLRRPVDADVGRRARPGAVRSTRFILQYQAEFPPGGATRRPTACSSRCRRTQRQAFGLLRHGVVVGKALAGNGSVDLPATFDSRPPAPGSLTVALDADGAAPWISRCPACRRLRRP